MDQMHLADELRCTCESAVARESKPERHSFEMMLNVEKDPALQKAGRKAF